MCAQAREQLRARAALCQSVAARRSRVGWEGGGAGLAAGRGARQFCLATRSHSSQKLLSRARQPKPSARAVSLGSAMRRLALENPLGGLYPHCGREGNQKTWGFPTLIGRLRIGVFWFGGRRVSRVRGFDVDHRAPGEASLDWCVEGDCVSSVAKRWPIGAGRHRFFLITTTVQLFHRNFVISSRREQRGFRQTEKIIGHVQNVIKPDCGLVRLSQTNLRLTAGADPPLFRSSRARVSRPSLPLAPDTPPRPARAPPLRRRDTGEGNAAGDFEPGTSHELLLNFTRTGWAARR